MSKSELKEKGNSICDLIRMGDKHAFEDLYRKYYPALCELSRAMRQLKRLWMICFSLFGIIVKPFRLTV